MSNLNWRATLTVIALLAAVASARAQIAVAPGAMPGAGIRPVLPPGAVGAGGVGAVPDYALSTVGGGNPYYSTGSLSVSPYGGYSLSTGGPFNGGFIPPYSLPYYNWGMRMDPYSGYLQGLASVTSATGQYYKDIQQARITRYQANMAALDFARARLRFERDYEAGRWRAYREDLASEKRTALQAARDASTQGILSGTALNELLKSAKSAGSLSRGVNIPLDEDVLRRINLSDKATSGNAGMLKDGGKLSWPSGLTEKEFTAERDRLSRNLEAAVKTIKDGKSPDEATLKDLRADFDELSRKLNDNASSDEPLPVSQYLDAKRYLGQLRNALTALRDPKAKNYLDNTWNAKGRTVAELIDYMRREGLTFNAATPGDEAAYSSLYDSLRRFERSLTSAGQP